MYQDSYLKEQLDRINRRGYPAYKDLRGSYRFPGYVLHIEHVQGDPFAAPSKLSVEIPMKTAAFPAFLFDTPWKKTALEDRLIREFGKVISQYLFQAKGSGKSGLIAVSRPGQQVLERTALTLDEQRILVRFEVGFPANGRTINSPELEKILFRFIPDCVKRALIYKNLNAKALQAVADLADDRQAVRDQLDSLGLCAFVADGSILPRESGVSDRPMKDAVPFKSPAELSVTLTLPHAGEITGMGVKKGITLIVGGGYHGKSTLLKALEFGVYNHIAGDGREFVITDASAMKIRAEDGRAVSHVNISAFINHLPNGKNTVDFSTEDASGSTSQAANVVEAVDSGSRVLLIDEDTSATNFMVRDSLMQAVIARDKEPITPFIEQARTLYEKFGVSTILVAGSSGAYFSIADVIIQLDTYRVYDITKKVHEICDGQGSSLSFPPFSAPAWQQSKRVLTPGRIEKKHDQIKVKQFGKDSFLIGRETVDLKYVEQLADGEQTSTLAQMLKSVLEELEKNKHQEIGPLLERTCRMMEKSGSAAFCRGTVSGNLAAVRPQEIYACINRYRGFHR